MELISTGSGLSDIITKELAEDPFVLFDIGCSGGIDSSWRKLQPNFISFGFDPNIAECARLKGEEKNPHVKYFNAFVSGLPGDDFSRMRENLTYNERNLWKRTACYRILEKRRAHASMSAEEMTKINLWTDLDLADPNASIHLPNFLNENNIPSIDFLKIDIDGADFEVLHSMKLEFDTRKILAVGMEVN